MAFSNASRRGGPLVTLVVIGVAWVGARLVLWENPFPVADTMLPPNQDMLIQSSRPTVIDDQADSAERGVQHIARVEKGRGRNPSHGAIVRVPIGRDVVRISLDRGDDPFVPESRWASLPSDYSAQSSIGHTLLWREAMHKSGRARLQNAAYRSSVLASNPGKGSSPTGPVTPQTDSSEDRWTLDTWGFFRQGSSAAPVSQGRVPTYGASQAGAKLAYRLAPKSRHDPRLFARAYSALIANGESEIAVGGSARIFPKVPVRLAGEVRYTDSVLGGRFRPAAYAFTEIPPISLPARFSLEAYAQGGYVGGTGSTFFADGQASATRKVTNFNAGRFGDARLSIGGGFWGGAQRGAHRVDVGPTMRVDMTIGKLPARISVDWRQKVAGDAAPESGVAATLSTRF
ncbi:MAG: hypothetical protein AAGL10_11305 [Pseudomonadota bacterium]